MDGKLKLDSGYEHFKGPMGWGHGNSDAQRTFLSLGQIKCVYTIDYRFLRELDRSADQVAGSTPGKI